MSVHRECRYLEGSVQASFTVFNYYCQVLTLLVLTQNIVLMEYGQYLDFVGFGWVFLQVHLIRGNTLVF